MNLSYTRLSTIYILISGKVENSDLEKYFDFDAVNNECKEHVFRLGMCARRDS